MLCSRTSDHIFRAIISFPGFYHHGIYIDDQTVVEFGGGISSASKSKCLQKVSLKEFTADQPLYRRDYRGYSLPPNETKKLAMEALEKKFVTDYNLITNNCEHFATSMKLKINWSSQVCVQTPFTLGI